MAHDHDVYMMLADSATEQEDLPTLEKYAAVLEVLARRDDHRLYLPIAQRALGAMHRLRGDFSASEDCLQEALVAFKQMGTSWQYGRTLVEIGKLAQQRGEKEAANNALQEALVSFDELGAKPDREKAQRVLELVSELR